MTNATVAALANEARPACGVAAREVPHRAEEEGEAGAVAKTEVKSGKTKAASTGKAEQAFVETTSNRPGEAAPEGEEAAGAGEPRDKVDLALVRPVQPRLGPLVPVHPVRKEPLVLGEAKASLAEPWNLGQRLEELGRDLEALRLLQPR